MSLFRALVYGAGGLIAVTAVMAGLEHTITGPSNAPEIGAPATILDDFTEDVAVVRDGDAQAKNFPALATEGVTVIHAPGPEERGFAAEETIIQEQADTRERIEIRRTAERERRVERSRQHVRASEPRAASSPVATAGPENAEEPRYGMRPTGNAAEGEAYEEEYDDRSWYGSPAYRREVEQRRQAERETQRRRQ